NEEYRFYQVLLAAWPADDAEPDDTFRGRMREHWRKAVNEAKRNTSWVQPNEPWLEAGERFLEGILNAETGREFLASFRDKARRVAHLGMVNSLAQMVLKAASPGVPDFYQGCELWDLSLVDPDNRREVDFARRQELVCAAERVDWRSLLANWESGAIKLNVIAALLRFRGEEAELFRSGTYRPLEVTGRFADNVVAFAREAEGVCAVVIAPRLTSALGCPPLGLVWGDTAVSAPAVLKGWRNAVTGREVAGGGELKLADLLGELPFAVLRGRTAVV
ncbi:MAG TPA: hypothetical protein VEA63_10940, partial [Opitutus sp.]|nr:hypothetical protein [Opitutus sp.]